MAIERQIYENLAATIQTLPWVNYVGYETIKIAAGDFDDIEVPAVQFFDGGQVITHEQGRLRTDWTIIVELVDKQTRFNEVNQLEFLDKRQELEQVIGGNVRLQSPTPIQGMVHVRYTSNITNLNVIEPYFITQLSLVASYYKDYTGFC